jgi:hypothetical protein
LEELLKKRKAKVMKKWVVVFTVMIFVATSSAAYAASVGGHGGQDVTVEIIENVEAPSEEVLAKIGVLNPIQILPTTGITVKPEQKAQIAFDLGSTSAVAEFPPVRVEVASGATATVALKVATTSLLAGLGGTTTTPGTVTPQTIKPQDIKLVLWHATGNGFTTYTYVPTLSVSSAALKAKADDKTFTFVDEDGAVVTEFESGKDVYPLFDVVDDSDEDVNREPGVIEVNSAAVVASGETGGDEGGDSGGGCDAGFSAGALSLLAAGWLLFRKRGA